MLAPPQGEISTCVVLSDLDTRGQVEDAAAGLFPVGGGFGQRWALTNAERFESPRDRYELRESRSYWLAATALIAATWAFSLWILRSDLAVFAVAGLRARGLIMLTLAEMLVIALGVGAIVTGIAMLDVVAHRDALGAIGIGLRAACRTAIAGLGVCAACAAATSVLISRRTFSALKDR